MISLARKVGPTDLRYRSPEPYDRPLTRADCPEGPCPFVGCRHHLAIDVRKDKVHIDRRFLEWLEGDGDMPEMCSLNLSEDPHSLEEVGTIMDITRERVRQIEVGALAKAKDRIDREILREDPLPASVPIDAILFFGGREE